MINQLIQIALDAGSRILSIYDNETIAVHTKKDGSALTQADTASHHLIVDALHKSFPTIPIISEESSKEFTYEDRCTWDTFFLVDPLDGTKEFIKRNGEFTVNIALIKNNKPILGVIYAPVLKTLYYAEQQQGAYKIYQDTIIPLPRTTSTEPDSTLRVVASRSHRCEQTEAYIKQLEQSGKTIVLTSAGSALKFGLIAEGAADIYPRFVPTMEWDTAAGHILITETGKKIMLANDTSQELTYNKEVLVNPAFIVM